MNREGFKAVGNAALRAGLQDSTIKVRTRAIGKWNIEEIPAGSREESGAEFSQVLNVGYNELPPAGRVYLVGGAARKR